MKRRKQPPINALERFAEVDLGAQLADLKLAFYQQSLLLSALIDHLVDKGLIEPEELAELAARIDKEITASIEE
ncbi:hypothetical protein [Laceyella putida]|jgi:hypothetical protein|uniref:Uncharacterized protein n=1 Tax=Laceyella putida TaxID=110101 RepID=A0ABW2RGQ6_9BACL